METKGWDPGGRWHLLTSEQGLSLFSSCVCCLRFARYILVMQEVSVRASRVTNTWKLHCFYSFSVSLKFSSRKYRARPWVLAETALGLNPALVTSCSAPGSQACLSGQGLHERVLRKL